MELTSAMAGSVVSFFLVAILVVQAPLPSSAVSVTGKVSCMDCARGANLTGIGLAVKCDNSTRLSFVSTDVTGHFSAELPLPASTPGSTAPSCAVAVLGGNRQLCAYRRSITSRVVRAPPAAPGSRPRASYTISTPLSFFTSCARFRSGNGGQVGAIGGSKTVDVPFPPEWGLAPSSYYLLPFSPFFAIFSIP